MPDRSLARPLTLADGRQIRKVSEAHALLAGVFATTSIHAPLEHALELLIAANTSGKRADLVRATDQLERVLIDRRLIATPMRE